MADEQARPVPEALLAEAKKEGRGRLKVFLGAAPGVGKTYAMLEDAQRRRLEKVDVVVGVVETHGRTETEALLRGLEIVPRRRLLYRGRVFAEMDLEAILLRRPKLVLVDELAHTNVPGSRHVKRYQDVEDVLAAGIDVYTTLNIQHLESVNDVVARISHVRVRETLPDSALELADDIELIDLPPDDLLQRLREGKVYVPEQARRAIQHFFSKGNLTAFRELAMRVAAERVDAQMINYMKTHAIPGPWPIRERLLVCVNESPLAKTLVRSARRMAERQRVPWIALSVQTPRHERLPPDAKDRAAEAMRLAERLGAEAVTIHAESNVAVEIVAYARSRNVSRIVIGRPRRRKLTGLFREEVTARLLKEAKAFEVTIVAAEESAIEQHPIQASPVALAFDWRAYGWGTAITAAGSLLAFALEPFLPIATLSLVFLLAVLLVAVRFGLWPSLYASFLSFLAYNFFFTEPYFTLAMIHRHDIVTVAIFFVVAIIAGNLAGRLKAQVESMRRNARQTANLYEFSKKIAAAASLDDVLWAAMHHVASTLQCRALVLLPRKEKGLEIAAGFPPEDRLEPKDRGAAEWAWENGQPAGWRSDTLPAASWLFLPLVTARGPVGVLGVSFEDAQGMLSSEQRRLLDALVGQVAVAIERTNLASDLEEARVLTETERLRSALLSSISHDLRTPLVAILGSASSLLERETGLSESQRGQLTQTIRDEAERLNRFVQNLLDMTRIGYGALQPKRDWVDLRDIVGRALRQLKKELDGRAVDVAMPADLPLLFVDPVLIEQVAVNILDNAIKYSPVGGRIGIEVATREDAVAVRIVDQGPGIPPEDRELVFDMFYRVRRGDSQVAGTGLGLSICRGLIEAHGGQIAALPGPEGRGTTIEFTLPMHPPPSLPEADEPARQDAASP